jgi:carbamoylphosphate synthase large subunit
LFNRIDEIINYPVFVKPDNYYGAQGTELVDNETQLVKFFNNGSNHVVCEYLKGEEYTVDCFSYSNSELIFCEGSEIFSNPI